jgi:hypothetical protein
VDVASRGSDAAWPVSSSCYATVTCSVLLPGRTTQTPMKVISDCPSERQTTRGVSSEGEWMKGN